MATIIFKIQNNPIKVLNVQEKLEKIPLSKIEGKYLDTSRELMPSFIVYQM